MISLNNRFTLLVSLPRAILHFQRTCRRAKPCAIQQPAASHSRCSQAANRARCKQTYPTHSYSAASERSEVPEQCSDHCTSTREHPAECPVGTGSAQSHQRLCGGTDVDRHQDQHADHGDAAGDFSRRAEKIRDQNPQNLAGALRYAPSVRTETFGNDTRNYWFKIRGFDAQDVGLFQDELQLSSFAFATWKFPPWGIQRIDILRGPQPFSTVGASPADCECHQQETSVHAEQCCRD